MGRTAVNSTATSSTVIGKTGIELGRLGRRTQPSRSLPCELPGTMNQSVLSTIALHMTSHGEVSLGVNLIPFLSTSESAQSPQMLCIVVFFATQYKAFNLVLYLPTTTHFPPILGRSQGALKGRLLFSSSNFAPSIQDTIF